MFGLYRLILALFVALSHVGLIIHGFNIGQWAVICFYVLSGFLMERQFHKLAPNGGVRAFYLDRFFRIYPVYFVVVVLCAFTTPISRSDTIINFSLLPLNYSSYTGVPILVGPAWSLACEAHFYLLVPVLAVMSTVALRTLLTISLIVFALSEFLPNGIFWGYTGLPGILFTFLSGIMINRRDWRALRIIYGVVAVLGLAFMLSKIFSTGVRTGININVCFGYLIAIPSTVFLGGFSPKVVWDQILGLFSYPLFLVHTLILGLCFTYLPSVNVWMFIGLSLLASGLLVIVIEKPSDLIRYRMRKTKTSDVSKSEDALAK